jgi:hypothetical protein
VQICGLTISDLTADSDGVGEDGAIVYYSFCKLLSRRKKIKRLQYSKERDYNPEGL